MRRVFDWLSGRKTDLVAAQITAIGIAALCNDWAELEYTLPTIFAGAGFASFRAAIKKLDLRLSRIAPLLLLCFFLPLGCASLSKVNPETGKTQAEEIQSGIAAGSAALPFPWNVIIPSVSWAGLTAAAALGQKGEGEPNGGATPPLAPQ